LFTCDAVLVESASFFPTPHARHAAAAGTKEDAFSNASARGLAIGRHPVTVRGGANEAHSAHRHCFRCATCLPGKSVNAPWRVQPATDFNDEIADMSPLAQAKSLRAVEYRYGSGSKPDSPSSMSAC
jgi:hypothetical protein